MADVTGPISSMPGSQHTPPTGMMCDCCDSEGKQVLAVKRVQGETDSMGCEMSDFCQSCFDKFQAECKKAEEELAEMLVTCNYCKGQVPYKLITQKRDWEEGSCGRLYDVCLSCCQKQNAECDAELAGRERYDMLDMMAEQEFD